MPLTPAEVHNVAFKKPPIGKRGYDEEEVDAFLDIVEVELSRLIEENNDLKGPGGAAQGTAAAPESEPAVSVQKRDGGAPDEALSGELAGAREENRRLQSHIAELERALSQGKDGAQQQVVQLQQQLTQTEQQLAESRQHLEQAQQAAAQAQEEAAANAAKDAGQPAAAPDVNVQAVQMLALAQQTADQHLAQSKAEAERLLNEARSSAEATLSAAAEQSQKHVGDAEARANQLDADSTSRAKKRDEESTSRATRTIQDAEQRAATITAQLEQRKSALERRVEELRTFEREYRTRLKSYLESQLRDLDASGRAEPAAPAAQQDGMVDAQQN